MLTKLLERAIEIEGLLRIIRDGKPLPETYSLLSAKAVELAEDCMKLEEQCGDTAKEQEPKPQEMPEIVIVDAPTSHKKEELPEVKPHEETSDADLPLEEDEDDILLAIEDETEEANDIPDKKDRPEEAPFFNNEEAPLNSIEKKNIIKLKSAFSLNDRFLYSRELFDGNMKMFDSTLDFIEGIEEYSIIEDYFYNELEWDPENRDVASFMEILRPHFRE